MVVEFAGENCGQQLDKEEKLEGKSYISDRSLIDPLLYGLWMFSDKIQEWLDINNSIGTEWVGKIASDNVDIVDVLLCERKDN